LTEINVETKIKEDLQGKEYNQLRIHESRGGTSESKEKNKSRNGLTGGCRCASGGSEGERRKIKLAGAYYEIILRSGGLAPGVLNLGISWGGGQVHAWAGLSSEEKFLVPVE
jgi:hypothetical protein